MFPNRMARKTPAYGPLSLLSLFISVTAGAFTLTNELAVYIPGCAQVCFLSFLAVNYKLDRNGETPSLQHLCSRFGSTGFTVGEGGLQCIAAEKAVGSCSPYAASNSVIDTAYRMCNDQPNAVRPTHGTITATLILPPTSGGAISVPFPTDETTTSFEFASTLLVDTRTAPTGPYSPTTTYQSSFQSFSTYAPTRETSAKTASTTTSSASETTTTAGAPAGAADEADRGHSSTKPLSTGQVVGVSIGAAGGVGLLIALILLGRTHFKKKKEEEPVQQSIFFAKRDSWDYNIEQGPDSGASSWIAHQMRGPLDPNSPPPLPPKAYGRTSWHPNAIGLAISPAHPPGTPKMGTPKMGTPKTATPKSSTPRRLSKLLPAKPILPLYNLKKTSPPRNRESSGQRLLTSHTALAAAPDKFGPPTLPKLQIPLPGGFMAASLGHRRDSSLTEFEEDGRVSMSPGCQIWRPPLTTPMSATAYYVADKYGNWVLGHPSKASTLAELEAPTPLTTEPKLAQGVPASLVAGYKPIASGAIVAQPKEAARASLVSPIQLAPAAEVLVSPIANSEQTVAPRPLFSGNPNPRYSNRRSLTRQRTASTDSGITTITTSSDCSNGPSPPAEEQVNLSPVFESPSSPTGISPVSYPKIPGRGIGNVARGNANVVPPPMRPILYPPPGQSGPALGPTQSRVGPAPAMSAYNFPRGERRVTPAMNTAGARIPNMGNANINPALLRTGSPTMRIIDPSPEPDDRGMLPSLRTRGPSVPQQQSPQYRPNQSTAYPRPQPQPRQHQQVIQPPRPFQPPTSGWGLPANPHPYRNPQQAPAQPRQPPRQQYQPASRPQQHAQQHPYQQHPQQYPQRNSLQQHPPQQQYQQQPNQYALPQHPRQNRPSYQQLPPSLLAKRLGTDRAANMSIGTDSESSSSGPWRRDGLLSPGLMTPRQQTSGDAPSTPTWLPRLTPTRRGDDLFLNVQ